MQVNDVKRKLNRGEIALGTLVFEFDAPGLPRLCELAGAEFVVFDMEHSRFSLERITQMLAWCKGRRLVPLVRPPATVYHLMSRPMDAGAMGLMVPMVESADQARQIVRAIKYAPMGGRGTAFGVAHDDYNAGDIVKTMQENNRESMILAQIESARGVAQIDDILSVEGIDVAWVGHFDLTQDMGIPGQFSHPDYLRAMDRVAEAAARHGAIAGRMVTSPEEAVFWANRGFRMLAYGVDSALYRSALETGLQAIHTKLGAMPPRRIVPEKGIAVPDVQRRALAQGIADLANAIEKLQTADPEKRALLPDVEIYLNAVQYALDQDIFYDAKDIAIAHALLVQGAERAAQLQQGHSPWTKATGLIVRGYTSKLDGSVQPYGLWVPENYDPARKHRLDIWHHGRNNKLSELRFIHDRQTNPGPFTPAGAFVLHTYGRYCNAMKFAGEVDTFEALAHAKQHYAIDEDRLAMRGFSMGGAAVWHLAVHHAGLWVAATPGAGFAETAIYQNALAKDPVPPAWEQKLWQLYDATICAANLHQCPTIAYSGENDKQKQAADIMAEHMKKEGLDMVHVIGPGVEHKYHPDSKIDIENRLKKIIAKGRNRSPEKIRFVTYTLRYNQMLWVRIDGLEKHWEEARVEADVIDRHTVQIKTRNITGLTLDLDTCPVHRNPTLLIDGVELRPTNPSGLAHIAKENGRWKILPAIDQTTLRKVHGLQGPIDDAFMDSFLMVKPTGKPIVNAAIATWIAAEQTDAIYQWHMQFRGQPRVKPDTGVTAEDMEQHNLILWGDPQSNALLKKIAPQLPIRWNEKEIIVGHRTFDARKHVPVLIFPNPLNPRRYIVLNSGFTFAPQGAKSNATQTPKLPDWAILDIAGSAGVVACDFFNERWEVV